MVAPKTPRKQTPVTCTPRLQLQQPAGLRTPQSRPSSAVPSAPRRLRIGSSSCARVLFKGEF